MGQNSLDIAWMLIAAALVMMMQIGFCFLESGLVRAKNSINVAVKNMADFCISAGIYWLVGFGIMFGSSQFGFWGNEFFMFEATGDWWLCAFFVFQLVFCGTAITIISGAVAERMRFNAYLLIALFTSGLVYPFFGHWAWGGVVPSTEAGWLANLGFLDFAGSTVVHSVGGWVSFAAILVIGPRIGQFDDQQKHIQGHNLTIASGGVIILWVGWIGFNGGSTLAMNDQVPQVIANTIIAGAFGGLAAMLFAQIHFGMTRTWTLMNGIIGGLVSITACANVVSIGSAAIIGAVAGALCFLGILLLEHFKVDDAVGAVPAHAFCGVWGTLAVAILGQAELWNTGHSRTEQLAAQLIGILTCFLWTFGSSFLFFKILNRFVKLRVTPTEEQAGLNISEHGASTALLELITEMHAQENASSINRRVHVEAHTEVGQIAAEYNRVLDRIDLEFQRHEALTQQAREAQEEAVHAAEVKSNFLANMSHELRTPLGIIMGYINIMQEDLKNDPASLQADDLDTIAQASHHLLNLINGVLNISKLESGKMEVFPAPIDILLLVKGLSKTVHPLILENNNTLNLEIQNQIGTLITDEVKLQQCLLNLISNAAKFTKNGQINLRIYRKIVGKDKEFFYIEVQDTGIGIKKVDLEAIFDAFTQADSSPTRQYGGTGLGLSITKNFAEILGGDLSVKSKYGKGSCFTLRLPSNFA